MRQCYSSTVVPVPVPMCRRSRLLAIRHCACPRPPSFPPPPPPLPPPQRHDVTAAFSRNIASGRRAECRRLLCRSADSQPSASPPPAPEMRAQFVSPPRGRSKARPPDEQRAIAPGDATQRGPGAGWRKANETFCRTDALLEGRMHSVGGCNAVKGLIRKA